MSFKSKRTIASMLISIAAIVGYAIYAAAASAPDGVEVVPWWALRLLVFVAIVIAVQLAGLVLFHIAAAVGMAVRRGGSDEVEREISSAATEDEMDRLIGLRAERVGYICAGIGLVATLILLAAGGQVVAALHLLLGSFFLGSLVGGALSVHGYERGIRNA